jgi:oligopeptide transport system substrate-binding protein
MIKKWSRNKEIVLIKNPTYWNSHKIYLEEIIFNIIADGRTAIHMFENEELDFVSTVTTPLLNEDLFDQKRKNQLIITPMEGLLFCTFNLDKFPYQNQNIRKALSYAINRRAIVENISQLSEVPATGCLTPSSDRTKNLFPCFDQQLAKTLFTQGLDELGISISDLNNLQNCLVLNYHNEEPYKKIAETIQQQWEKTLGIHVQLKQTDHKSHLSNIMNKDYSMALYNCIAQCTDPTHILDRFKYRNGKKNYPSFEKESYIKLLNKASELNDASQRISILDEAEALLMNEMPIAPIYHFNQGVLLSKQFSHIEFSPLSNLLFSDIQSNTNNTPKIFHESR